MHCTATLPWKGKVVAAAWNFEGLPKDLDKKDDWNFEASTAFPVKATIRPVDKRGTRASIKATYTFNKAGTFFPTLRVASQRHGDAKTPFTKIQNLDRVRVVVQ